MSKNLTNLSRFFNPQKASSGLKGTHQEERKSKSTKTSFWLSTYIENGIERGNGTFKKQK